MNPGLVVKLRPTGPWRIGPDSGARNRVDTIYHSDTLYAAVTGAMARLGPLEEWLAATARNGSSAVRFSSCFPFLDEVGFIVPPRTVWPPTSPALLSARLRWKSARFVPLGMVPEILAGRALDDSQWSVDAASECLVPAGRLGPFRAGMRSNAAVDRLSGAAERHSTACIEFRPGAGLWTVVSFADDAAATQWMGPVKTAFRLLADSGFGGERSRGWGRSEAPEFIEGVLPEMILPAIVAAAPPPVEEPPAEPPSVDEPPSPEPPREEPPPVEEPSPEEPPAHEASVLAPMAILPLSVESVEAELARISVEPLPDETSTAAAAPDSAETAPEPAAPGPSAGAGPVPGDTASSLASPDSAAAPAPALESTAETASNDSSAAAPATPATAAAAPEPATSTAAGPPVSEPPVATESAPGDSSAVAAPAASDTSAAPALELEPMAAAESASQTAISPPGPDPQPPPPDPEPQPEPAPPVPEPEPEPQPPTPAPLPGEDPTPPILVPPVPAPEPEPLPEPGPIFPDPLPAAPQPSAAIAAQPHWLLSLFTPGPADAVDWARGSYSLVARGGRIESPVRSGERKKQLPMIVEGSVIYVAAPPAGSAPDVAPEGFVHPVYRAGFALSIPLPEVR